MHSYGVNYAPCARAFTIAVVCVCMYFESTAGKSAAPSLFVFRFIRAAAAAAADYDDRRDVIIRSVS